MLQPTPSSLETLINHLGGFKVLVAQINRLPWREKAGLVGELGTLEKGHEEIIKPALLEFSKDTDFFVRKAAEGALYQLIN